MPCCSLGYRPMRKKTWKTMARWERKNWHRRQSERQMRGLSLEGRP